VPVEPRVLRLTPSEPLVDEWHLCLLAEGVRHHIEPVDGQLALVVLEEDVDRADEMLREYDEERRQRAAERAIPAAPDSPSSVGVISVLLLGAFYAASLRFPVLYAAGRASAADIVHGQIWRSVTALTLHADYMHLGGNIVAALIFFTALGRWLGGGVAALSILIAGALANWVNAQVQAPPFSSIGASTATFAGLGMLMALQLRRRKKATRRERLWLPVAAALGVFAMLGVGGKQDHHIDVLAHLFGLISGAAVGAVLSERARRQWLWGGAAILLLGAAWGAALLR
jgi:rhomboid protease GluP